MAHEVRIKTAIDCARCGAEPGSHVTVVISGLNPEYRAVELAVGDIIEECTLDDFDDAFHRLRDPDPVLVKALERWSCEGGRVEWAMVTFRRVSSGYAIESVEHVEFTRQTLQQAAYVSTWIDLRLESNPDRYRDTLDLLEPVIPWAFDDS